MGNQFCILLSHFYFAFDTICLIVRKFKSKELNYFLYTYYFLYFLYIHIYTYDI